jgi:hypothetical protein
MKTYNRITVAIFMALLMSILVIAGEEGNRSKSFNVSKGGEVEVITSVGDIKISVWDKNVVEVKITGMDDEDFNKVKMTQNGNNILVSFRSQGYGGLGNIDFDISVPSEFNVFMNTSGGDLEVRNGLTGKITGSTSGGDIKLGDVFGGPFEVSTSGGDITTNKIDGNGKLKTSGGDIRVGQVNGSILVHTSGGDIQIESVTKSLDANTSGGNINIGNAGGEARVSTSGGNINIGDIGSEANVSTSGGDISVGKVTGKASLNTAGGDIKLTGAKGRVIAKTSGGDLNLRNVTGSIEGKTSGGEIEAQLTPSGKESTRLISAGGDVRLYIDEKSKVTIEATIRLDGWHGSGEKHKVISEFPKEKTESEEDTDEIREVYKLNGGGESVILRTSDSNIEIHKLRK